MLTLILTLIATALSLMLITRLGIGISVRDFNTALIAALVMGLINAFLGPALGQMSVLPTALSVNLVTIIVNALLFWLATAIVSGFYLRNGFWSALVGSILLAVSNGVILWVLGRLGIG